MAVVEKIMTRQELHEFGLQIVVNHLEAKGFSIEFVQPLREAMPHIFAKHGQTLTVIAVAVDMYPNKGEVGELDQNALKDMCKELSGKAAIANIGLANSAGVEAGDKELMGKPLKDCQFLADFGGLKYL